MKKTAGRKLVVDSHNSLLTNREMAILSSQIDIFAISASQTLKYTDINAYFNAAEHYYLKLASLLTDEHITLIESFRERIYKIQNKIENEPRYRNRRTLRLYLQITKDFYFQVRRRLQDVKYYFRTSERNDKGLSGIRFYDNEEDIEDSKDEEKT